MGLLARLALLGTGSCRTFCSPVLQFSAPLLQQNQKYKVAGQVQKRSGYWQEQATVNFPIMQGTWLMQPKDSGSSVLRFEGELLQVSSSCSGIAYLGVCMLLGSVFSLSY